MKKIYLFLLFFHFTMFLLAQNIRQNDTIYSQDCTSKIYGEVRIHLFLNKKNQLYTQLIKNNKQVLETLYFYDQFDENLNDLKVGLASKIEREPVNLYFKDIDSDGKEDLIFEYNFYIGAGPESGKVISRVECFIRNTNRWTWPYQYGTKKTFNWQYAYDRVDISYQALYNSIKNTGYLPVGYLVSSKKKKKLLMKANEKVILSFTTTTNKKVTLAVAENFSYLCYRFGTPSNIELSYKVTKNDSSKFKYSWDWEPLIEHWTGKEYNSTKLSFQISDYKYTIFQNRVDSISLEDIEYSFGITDKEYNLELLKQFRATKELDGIGILVTRISTNEKTIIKAKYLDIGGLKDLYYLPPFVIYE